MNSDYLRAIADASEARPWGVVRWQVAEKLASELGGGEAYAIAAESGGVLVYHRADRRQRCGGGGEGWEATVVLLPDGPLPRTLRTKPCADGWLNISDRFRDPEWIDGSVFAAAVARAVARDVARKEEPLRPLFQRMCRLFGDARDTGFLVHFPAEMNAWLQGEAAEPPAGGELEKACDVASRRVEPPGEQSKRNALRSLIDAAKFVAAYEAGADRLSTGSQWIDRDLFLEIADRHLDFAERDFYQESA